MFFAGDGITPKLVYLSTDISLAVSWTIKSSANQMVDEIAQGHNL
jgi:hypothetical protein